MIYNYKEYKPVFDTPMKRQQEIAIAGKIINLLNKNKYNNLEEFITKNNNYQTFLKNNNMERVIKHFGNTLKETDYIKILENLRVLTKQKQSFEEKNIKTTDLEDKQFNSFKGEDKTFFIDNSRSDKPIEEEMRDLQPTQQSFQTTDARQNTENMFKELEQKKEVLNLHFLHEINYDLLNDKEKELFQIAYNYQQKIKGILRIDLQKGIMVDEQNNIMKIEIFNSQTKKEASQEKSYQKQLTLTHNQNTIYSN